MKSLIWIILLCTPAFLWQTIVMQYDDEGGAIFSLLFAWYREGWLFDNYYGVIVPIIVSIIAATFVLALKSGITKDYRSSFAVSISYLLVWIWTAIEMRHSVLDFSSFLQTSIVYLCYVSALVIALIIIGFKQRKNLKTT